jgi:hypothetical protein
MGEVLVLPLVFRRLSGEAGWPWPVAQTHAEGVEDPRSGADRFCEAGPSVEVECRRHEDSRRLATEGATGHLPEE